MKRKSSRLIPNNSTRLQSFLSERPKIARIVRQRAEMAEYTDLIMCIGVLVLLLTFPTAVGAFSRGAPPRAAMLSLFAGGVMVVYANSSRPGGYSVEGMPELFLKVLTGGI
jgi:hypothetical protein